MAVIVSTRCVPREAMCGEMFGNALGGGDAELTEAEQEAADNWERRRQRRQAEKLRRDYAGHRRGIRLL